MSVSNGDFLDNSPDVGTISFAEMERIGNEIEEGEKRGKRAAITAPDRKGKRMKSFARLRLPEDSYDVFYMAAIEEELSIEEFHDVFVDTFLPLWRDKGRSSDPRVSVYWDIYESRRMLEQRDEAFRIAAELEKYPVPSLYEKLINICENLGLDVADVKDRVKHDPYGIAIFNSTISQNSVVRQRCLKWFISFVGDRSEIASIELIRAGDGAGYTDRVVRDCAKGAGWIPERDGRRWVWRKSAMAKLADGRVA